MEMTVKTFPGLRQYLTRFHERHFGLLVIVGPPGVQKSTLASEICTDAERVSGAVSAFGLYRWLYEHCDMDVIVDDVDGLHRDRAAVRLLKCLCEDRQVKTLRWLTGATKLEGEGLPPEFNTESRVVIIANDWDRLTKDLGALHDRGLVIQFRPDPQEIHRQVKEWFTDEEIMGFVECHIPDISQLSMRHYVEAAKLKNAGFDWRSALLQTWGVDPRIVVLRRLLGDSQLKPAERVSKFRAATGASRRTYFYLQRKLREQGRNPCTLAPAQPCRQVDLSPDNRAASSDMTASKPAHQAFFGGTGSSRPNQRRKRVKCPYKSNESSS